MNDIEGKSLDIVNDTHIDNNLVEEKSINKRDLGLDALKAILIILVVFGHAIEYLKLDGIFTKIQGVIYVFHMPVFIFISGYFSKKFEDAESKNIKNVLIPFFIFNTAYIILDEKTRIDGKTAEYLNIFMPVYAYWYLFSLFIWKVLIKYVTKFKFSIVLIFLISLYIGIVNEANRFLSVSRTLAFFPYFMLGYYTSRVHIEKIRKLNKKLTVPIILILMGITYILSDNIIDVELFKNAQSYHSLKVGNLKGMEIRTFQFCVSILMTVCLINLVPQKNNYLSNIGQKTITVYLLSSFIQKFMCIYIERNNIDIIGTNNISISICIISTILIVFICSLDKVHETYNKIIDWIYRKVTI